MNTELLGRKISSNNGRANPAEKHSKRIQEVETTSEITVATRRNNDATTVGARTQQQLRGCPDEGGRFPRRAEATTKMVRPQARRARHRQDDENGELQTIHQQKQLEEQTKAARSAAQHEGKQQE